MIFYQIILPKQKEADAFAKFMKEEYVPSIHKGATRVGQVLRLSLWQSHDSDADHHFLWEVDWSGLSGHDIRAEDESIQHKFEKYGAKLKHLGTYDEVAKWPSTND